MAGTLDLAAYFDRIGWHGTAEPTLATLSGLLDAHVTHIPFENLDVLLGREVRLDISGLQAKLVRDRRGGYCFEHATLFAGVLEALGFAPVRHAARVIVFTPRAASPRTHMFLSVTVDGGRYVVDPGFGLFASRKPLALDGGGVPAERPLQRMAREGNEWVLHLVRDGVEVPAWVSTMTAETAIDFEVANHFTATHPQSPFVNWFMGSAVTPDGRVNVMNRDVTHVHDGTTTKASLPDRAALRALLARDFGIDLPEVETLRIPGVPEWA
jgi:N-hydroxyarylamine O-acetyltransferase